MNSFTRIFRVFSKCLGKFVHDFWEEWFRKPKLLSAANRLKYITEYITRYIKYSQSPAQSAAVVSYIEQLRME